MSLFYPQGLPMTSYYKLIDWWLSMALYILVMTMAFHTYLAHVVSKAKGQTLTLQNLLSESKWLSRRNESAKELLDAKAMKSAKLLNAIGRTIFAILMIAFNTVFWTVAIKEYIRPAEDYI